MKPQRDQQDNHEVDSYCQYGCQTLLKLVPSVRVTNRRGSQRRRR